MDCLLISGPAARRWNATFVPVQSLFMRLRPDGTSRVAKRLEKCQLLHMLDSRDCVAPAPPWYYNFRFASSREHGHRYDCHAKHLDRQGRRKAL